MDPRPTAATDERLARGLGWFSLAIGTPQLTVPTFVDERIGVRDSARNRALHRLVGARALLAGAGILVGRRPAGWLWSRVAGDVMDLVLLGAALRARPEPGRRLALRRTRARRPDPARRRRTAVAFASVVGITILDLATAVRLSRPSRPGARRTRLGAKAAVTVNRPVEVVYPHWRDLTNLPTFMIHLVSVEDAGGGRSRWTAAAPAGRPVTWEAEVIDDKPNERIAWRSVAGSAVPNTGEVLFTPAAGGRGTELRVELDYEVPGGRLGRVMAKVVGEAPEQQLRDDLRRFKQVIETGQVVRSEGSPEGLRARRQLRQRPARPIG